LRKSEREKLIEAGELFDPALSAMPLHHACKRHQRQLPHDLNEDELTCSHGNPRMLKA